MQVVDEAFRSPKSDRLLASDVQSQQAVEAHKVADMSMRYEYMLNAQDLARRQAAMSPRSNRIARFSNSVST